MKKFEYIREYMHSCTRIPSKNYLNTYGEQGWELVSIVPYQEVSSGIDGYYVYFKRELVDQ